jgi:hypothetical protein
LSSSSTRQGGGNLLYWPSEHMSQTEIDYFFNEYVFGFIAGDISREIELARTGKPAGNYLCALALLCYTEILGGVKRGTLAPGQSKTNFEAFFPDLGRAYADLKTRGVDVYSVFRCGMAHEYFIKGAGTVAMLNEGAPAGVWQAPDGRYWFSVERYFDDFIAAAKKLHAELRANASGALPPGLAGQV